MLTQEREEAEEAMAAAETERLEMEEAEADHARELQVVLTPLLRRY
jgi:hypothetical protein